MKQTDACAVEVSGLRGSGFRGGKVMKSLQILGIVGFAASMTGCVPDWARENETGLLMEIAGITGQSGAPGIEDGDILMSDVTPVFNDDAVVTVNLYRKNPTVAATSSAGGRPARELPGALLPLGRTQRRRGRRAAPDHRPHQLGPAAHPDRTSAEFEAEVLITVVRHQAKLEPPLINLTDFLINLDNRSSAPGGAGDHHDGRRDHRLRPPGDDRRAPERHRPVPGHLCELRK